MSKLVVTMCSLSFLNGLVPLTLAASPVAQVSEQAMPCINGLVLTSPVSSLAEESMENCYGILVDPSVSLPADRERLFTVLKKHLGSALNEAGLQKLREDVAMCYPNGQIPLISVEAAPQDRYEGLIRIEIDPSLAAAVKNPSAQQKKFSDSTLSRLSPTPPSQYLLTAQASHLSSTSCADETNDEAASPSTQRKLNTLAEKLDQLTASADALYSKNTHVNVQTQRHLESALGGLFVSADFLYWQADEDKLEYAINFQGFFGNSSLVYDKFAGLNFEWNPGFRVALGATSCDCDHWGIFANYTYIHNKAHGSINVDPPAGNNIILPSWDQLLMGIFTMGGHARWSVNYSTEHLEAYKDYFVGKNCILRPHMGLINANINQEYHVNYDLIPNISADIPQSIMHAKCNYWGLGVGGGADMLWHFTPHFGLYGELSLGLVYGRFDINRNGTSVFPTNTNIGTPFSFHFKKEMWRTRATLQTALGFEWETVFNRDRNRIAISLGYEFNEWFQQNQFVSSAFNSDNNIAQNGLPLNSVKFANADLAFKGGTLRATFNF